MKKFVIIALIFALVAGAAFAQDGSWSVSGQGEVGTMLNFAGPKQFKSDIQAQEDEGTQGGEFIVADNSKPLWLIGVNGYNNVGYYGYVGGMLNVNYNKGGFKAGLEFLGQRNSSYIAGVLGYTDATRAFEFKHDIISANPNFATGKFAPERLWGYYKFLDGKIHLEAAYNSRDTTYWGGGEGNSLAQVFGNRGDNGGSLVLMSGSLGYGHLQAPSTASGTDSTGKQLPPKDSGGIGSNNGTGSPYGMTVHGLSNSLGFDDMFGRGFTKVDHHNYLVVDVAPIDGLNFGFMIPTVFASGAGNQKKPGEYGGFTQETGSANGWKDGYFFAQSGNYNVEFLDNSLLQSRIGAKFASGPIQIAAQFALLGKSQKLNKTTYEALDLQSNPHQLTKLEPAIKKEIAAVPSGGSTEFTEEVKTINTGLFLSAKLAINDNLNAGLNFQGHFWSKTPQLGFSADVGFSAGAFHAGLAGGLYMLVDPTETLRYPYKKTDTFATTSGSTSKGIKNFTGAYDLYEAAPGATGVGVNVTQDDINTNAFSIEKNTVSLLGIKPSFTFALVENYLAASLDTHLYWQLGIHERKYQEKTFAYDITPELFFNVAGTGAGTGYYSAGNLIIVRYKIAGWVDGSEVRAMKKSHQEASVNDPLFNTRPVYNAVDITFKWTF